MNNKLRNEVSITQTWEVDIKDTVHKKRLVVFMYFFFLFFLSTMIIYAVIIIKFPAAYFNAEVGIGILYPSLIMLGSLVSTFFFIVLVLSQSNEIVFNFKEKIVRKKVLITILYFFILMISLLILSLIVNYIYDLTHDQVLRIDSNSNQSGLEEQIKMAPIYGFLVIVILGPLMEEMAFRYGMIGSFRNKWFGLVISSVIFGSLHLMASIPSHTLTEDLWTLPSYLLTGFIFGLLYIKTDNIVYSFGLHLTTNFIAFVLVFVTI